MNEARYSRLTREFPERAGELFERNEKAAIERYDHLVRLKAMRRRVVRPSSAVPRFRRQELCCGMSGAC